MIKNKVVLSVYLLLFVLVYGSVGYCLIEKWSIFESVYMTVITVSTIGFQEIHTLSDVGRVFTLTLVFFGLGVMAFCVNNGVRTIFEGEFQEIYRKRKLEKILKSLNNHYIVCGYGRMGKVICDELRGKGLSVIVIEHEDIKLDDNDNILLITGDATNDELLIKCGVQRAKGLITALSSDAENIYVVLSARGLNPDLLIVARASDNGAEPKLLRAGANKVVSPYQIGGLRIAHTVLKPAVVDFLEIANKSGDVDLEMEEILVEAGSFLSNKTIQDVKQKMDMDVILIAIQKINTEMIFHPPGTTPVRTGDKLITIGKLKSFSEFEKLAKPDKAYINA